MRQDTIVRGDTDNLERSFGNRCDRELRGTLGRQRGFVSSRRCLGTTHIIDSSHSAIRTRTWRVSRWKHAPMILRWAAALFPDARQRFRKILGYRDLWMLQAKFKAHAPSDDSSKLA